MYYYDLCEQYCLKTRDFYILSGLYKDMSDMYITQGDYKKAYEYHVAYKKSNDSLNAGRYLEISGITIWAQSADGEQPGLSM